MSKIIIAVHGLGNKPPKLTLRKWWKNSIREGFRIIGHPRVFFRFKMVYWAMLLHHEPLNPKIKDVKHPLYIEEPYMPIKKYVHKKPSKFRMKFLDYLEKQMDKLFLNKDLSINFASIPDFVIHHYFKDLDTYYCSTCLDSKNKERPARDVIREQLIQVLKKYRKRKIILIAHSMGSIIAYDVLNQDIPGVKVDTFVTIGSPLGLPVVISKIASEQHKTFKQETKVYAPKNVLKAWYNFSDLEDRVAIDYTLAGDFEPNSHGVRAIDNVVCNTYEINKHKNPHKAYGYLRTPEFAKVIHEFLDRDRNKLILWIIEKINRIFSPKNKLEVIEECEQV